jgi:Protein of unknown function (DUF3348)
MLHGTSSPGVAGSELTRLLALMGTRPADDRPAPRPAFADRLGHWLGWTGAIALSAALDAAPAAPAAAGPGPTGDEEADFQRVRAERVAALAAGPSEPASSPADFGPYRRHCLAQQQAMQQAVGSLRQRLRAALARHSAQGAQLAALDALLDPALAAPERTLLGLVPLRLQTHFEQLQATADLHPGWRRDFEQDLARVLTAELDHRLLPARGLLDALRQPITA